MSKEQLLKLLMSQPWDRDIVLAIEAKLKEMENEIGLKLDRMGMSHVADKVTHEN